VLLCIVDTSFYLPFATLRMFSFQCAFTEQSILNAKEDIDSPTIGIVVGSVAGASIIVIIIVIVVIVLCKRGVITKRKETIVCTLTTA